MNLNYELSQFFHVREELILPLVVSAGIFLFALIFFTAWTVKINKVAKSLSDLKAILNRNEFVGLAAFENAMEKKHYFQIQAWFSSEILRSFQSNRHSLLHSEWFIFLPVQGHETLDEIKLRKQREDPSELVYRGPAVNRVRIRSLESSEIKKDLKILCTSFDKTYHGEQEVTELIENFKLIQSN